MMSALDLIVLVAMLPAGLALKVEVPPSPVQLGVGEGKMFRCTVDEDGAKVRWFSSNRESLGSYERIEAVTQGKVAMLFFHNVMAGDSGIYRCMAKTAGGSTAEDSLQVETYYKLAFTDVQLRQDFMEGNDSVVNCTVSGTPQLVVVWMRNGRTLGEEDERFLLLTNNSLLIRSVRRSDRGVYRCEGRIASRDDVAFIDIHVFVSTVPTIRATSPLVNVTPGGGETAHLSCTVDGFPDPLVRWYRADIGDESPLEPSAKYLLVGGGTLLSIDDVTNDDLGLYVCSAHNKAGYAQALVTLIEHHVPVFPEVFVENHFAVEGDDSVQLWCQAEGAPTPTITWRRKDGAGIRNGEQASTTLYISRQPSPSNSSLEDVWLSPSRYEAQRVAENEGEVFFSNANFSTFTLRNVKRTDHGSYECVASNLVGITVADLFLNVTSAPKFRSDLVMFSTFVHKTINLSCHAIAHPSPHFVWSRNGQPLPSAHFPSVLIHYFENLAVLEITPEKDEDFGKYRCDVSNFQGNDSKEFILYQDFVPTIRATSPWVNVTIGRGETAHLSCTVHSSRHAPIQWYRTYDADVPLEPSAKYSFMRVGNKLVIHNVIKADLGLYVCRAQNKFGSALAIVTLIESYTLVPPSKVTMVELIDATEGDNMTQLTCQSDGVPTPTITWRRKDGTEIRNGEQTQTSSNEGEGFLFSAVTSTLTLTNLQYTNDGIYECVASNNAGTAVGATLLNVAFSPRFDDVPVTFYTWMGKAVNLTCSFSANHFPILLWYRNVDKIPFDRHTRHKISTFEYYSILQITPESDEDFGRYRCEASNLEGEKSVFYELILAVPPSAPSISNIRPRATSVDVRLGQPETTGGVPVSEFVIRVRPAGDCENNPEWKTFTTDSEQELVHLTGLEPEKRYDVQVAARNGAGLGEFNTSLQFETTPLSTVPWIHMSTRTNKLMTTDGTTAGLHCSYITTPGDEDNLEIEWIRDNASKPILAFTEGNVFTPERGMEGRVNFMGDYRKGDASIELHSLKGSDSGKYLCKVKRLGVVNFIEMDLIVFVTPIPNCSLEGGQPMEGKDVQMKCLSEVGTGEISYSWTRLKPEPRIPKQSAQGVLSLKNLTVDDGGLYQCEASTHISRAGCTFHLSVSPCMGCD